MLILSLLNNMQHRKMQQMPTLTTKTMLAPILTKTMNRDASPPMPPTDPTAVVLVLKLLLTWTLMQVLMLFVLFVESRRAWMTTSRLDVYIISQIFFTSIISGNVNF